MALDRNTVGEYQARLDSMTAELKAARQRRLVKQGMALWLRTEAAQQELDLDAEVESPPTKIN